MVRGEGVVGGQGWQTGTPLSPLVKNLRVLVLWFGVEG